MRKFVSTDYDGFDYITAGKLYEVVNSCLIVDDDGDRIYIPDEARFSWTVHNVGTPEEIGAKVGDVVGAVGYPGWAHTVIDAHYLCDDYYLISRATDDAPKTWGDMTDAEKGELLLWAHEGGEVQLWSTLSESWIDGTPQWSADVAYRKKPAEPVYEEYGLYGGPDGFGSGGSMADDYCLTMTTVDGEMQTGTFTNENGDVIKVEKL